MYGSMTPSQDYGSTTPRYGSSTPLHDPGSMTPNRAAVWDPHSLNTPSQYVFTLTVYT